MASLLVNWWVELCDTLTAGRLSLCLPDDRLFIAMLAAWVVLDALVSFALLGWQGAYVILAGGGLAGMVAIALQSHERRPRSSRAAEPS
jgi:hypothetical protein